MGICLDGMGKVLGELSVADESVIYQSRAECVEVESSEMSERKQ